ncbi:MAG: hypothetical protein HRU25_14000 [Psychrobium sp.]|nr:hypothetical protein [Psychrobium sp.]
MKKLSISMLLCCCSSVSFATNPTLLQQYDVTANVTSELITSAPLQEIDKSASQLVSLAKSILPKFTQKHPQCRVYLNAVLAAADSMQTLSLKDIELHYHQDQKLPALTSSDCYHAKDLLVHPATVVVMAKTMADNKANRLKMRHEIVEVIQHLSLVKDAVK